MVSSLLYEDLSSQRSLMGWPRPLWQSSGVQGPEHISCRRGAYGEISSTCCLSQTSTPVLLWLLNQEPSVLTKLSLRQHLSLLRLMPCVCYNELMLFCCMCSIAIALICSHITWGEVFSAVPDTSQDRIWLEYPLKDKETGTIKWFIQCPGIFSYQDELLRSIQ